MVWVTNSASDSVTVIDPDAGAPFCPVARYSLGTAPPTEPQGIATDSRGNVWVADTGNNRVVKFAADGQVVCCYPQPGLTNGRLSAPVSLAVDGQGSIYVSDSLNHRVVRLAATGDTG